MFCLPLTIIRIELEVVRALQTKLRDTICEWRGIRDNTIRMIRNITANLVTHRQNVNISLITGSLAAIGGSGIAILGFALAPVTFGASLGLTIVGVAIATAGGLTAAGASITDTALTKNGVTEAQKQLTYDQGKLQEIQAMQDQITEQNLMMKERCRNLKNVNIFRGISVFALPLRQVQEKTANFALKVEKTAATHRGVSTPANVFLNAVMIPIEILKSGWNIINGNESIAIKRLHHTADQLEEQKNEIWG